MSILNPVILAGGGGTRLWPLSREHFPKQFLNLVGEQSMLQQTTARLSDLGETDLGAPIVVCNESHRFLVAEQLRVSGTVPVGILLEPVGRNTAPALTAAALLAQADGVDPILLMMPADQVVTDTKAFQATVAAALPDAEAGALVVFGVVPDRPETGYGYIATGKRVGKGPALDLVGFVEKPDASTAKSYIAGGGYLWNAGLFMMKASVWLAAIAACRNDIREAVARAMSAATHDGDFIRLDREAFSSCPADSIDYAVMEKLGQGVDFPAVVLPLDCGWSDVGAWSSLWDVSARDDDGNFVRGDVCAIDTRYSVLISEYRLIAVVGCEDMVVVETADAVLVAPREHAQDVKLVVEWLKKMGREERLMHRRVTRPWGTYEGVDAGDRFQVKRIVVNPGAKLSLQMHHHRAEHWIVVKGTAEVTRGEEKFLLCENQSTYIPLGTTHRLANPGAIPLEIIEVQSGPYLGEDDIVRFDDVYKRS